jgi:hypothetical protein
MATYRSPDVKGPLARLNWTNDLFEPRASEPGKAPKYGVELLYPKTTDIGVLYQAVLDAANANTEWGGKVEQWLKDGLIKKPFLDGDGPSGLDQKTGERKKGYAGHWFIRATAQASNKPFVVDHNNNHIPDASGVKSGWYGYPVVHAFTWINDKGGKGVSIGISLLQVVKAGEPMGSGKNRDALDPSRFFEKVAFEGDAPAETKTGKGAAGLFG